jgi:hypothetical protein
VARHGTVVEHEDDSDLVVVDLDDAPPLSVRDDREAFEEKFAELAFGLGTVRRRIHTDRAARAPLWVLMLAVVAMFAVFLGNPGQSQSADPRVPAPHILEAPTGAEVLIVAYDRIEAVDVDRRTERVARLAGIPDGTAAAVVSAGDGFAVIVGGRAFGVSRRLDRPAVDLGPADALFRAGADGWVWLAVPTRWGWEAREVSVVSGAQGPGAVADPRLGTGRPIGVTDIDGAVLDRIEHGRRVIGSRSSSRVLPRSNVVLGLVDGSVASLDCADRTCTVVFTDLNTRGERGVHTPLPSGWSIGPSAVGQGDGAVAALASPPGGDTTRVLVARQGAARVIDVGGRATALAWSADWLFVTVDDGRLVAIGPAGGAQTVAISALPHGALIGS